MTNIIKNKILKIIVLTALIIISDHVGKSNSIILILSLVLIPLLLIKLNKKIIFFKFTWPLLAYLIVGLPGIFFNEFSHYIRDLAYIVCVIALLYIGYWFSLDNKFIKLAFIILMTYAVFFSLVHISSFILDPGTINKTFIEIKNEIGGTSYAVNIALIIAVLCLKNNATHISKFKYILLGLIGILSISLFLTFARSAMLFVIVATLSASDVMLKINLKKIALFILITVSVLISVDSLIDNDGSYIYQIARSLTEIAISDHTDWYDINKNWRGFEAYQGIITYFNGSTLQILFGQGFGALVDLGFYIKLGGDIEYRFIPVFHNGYVYLLLKTGLVGLFLFIYFFVKLLISSKINIRFKQNDFILIDRLLFGLIFSSLIVMYVVGGTPQMHGMLTTLSIGFLYGIVSNQENFDAKISEYAK